MLAKLKYKDGTCGAVLKFTICPCGCECLAIPTSEVSEIPHKDILLANTYSNTVDMYVFRPEYIIPVTWEPKVKRKRI